MRRVFVGVGLAYIGLIAWHFPWATDDPVRREDEQRAFYAMAYTEDEADSVERETEYDRVAQNARATYHIKEGVEWFVRQFHLEQAKVLDVGSGTGYLQDVVDDYTGLDISPTVAKHYHKPFVAGTATAMPFADSTFDAIWSIWVLEHIPNPEAALSEIRRVVKPGGYLFLQPTWNVKPWVAQGYEVRPYRDLSPWGWAIKATIPVRNNLLFWVATGVPVRVIRAATVGNGPSRLHYRRLTPNYERYWQADSDAVNSLDSVEMALWFESRGDECVTCASGAGKYLLPDSSFIVRVRAKQ
jgi:SAM-dependent methyltransferase